MEIHYQWRITHIVRDIPFNLEFSTIKIAELLKDLYSIDKKVSPVLDEMNCLERTHTGSLGGQGESRNPNRYIKRSGPGKICDDCETTTCMIRHVIMAQQLGLDHRIKVSAL